MNLYLGRTITQWNEKLATYLGKLKRFIVTPRQNKKLDCGSKIAEFLKESVKKYKIWKNWSNFITSCLFRVLSDSWFETTSIMEVDSRGETMLLKTCEVVSSPNGNTIQCDRTIGTGLVLPLPFPLATELSPSLFPVSLVIKSDLLRYTRTRMSVRCLTFLPQRCQNS